MGIWCQLELYEIILYMQEYCLHLFYHPEPVGFLFIDQCITLYTPPCVFHR